MSEISIKNLKNSIGKDVQINGWVYNIRSIGKIWFVIVRDGTGYVQCVVTKNDVSDKVFKLENSLTQESSLKIKGTVQADTRSDSGVEILVTDIDVVHIADEYPISLKEHGVSFLMDNRHLWLRSKKQFAIMKIRHQLISIDEIGYCSGIENYSRYFDGRKEGERPSTLIDFFPKDFLTIIDESHVTLPQIKGMYNGDRKRN